MPNPRKFKAAAKLEGKFKSGTRCAFNIKISEPQGIDIAKPFVKSFRHVMADLYKNSSAPALRKITITILMP